MFYKKLKEKYCVFDVVDSLPNMMFKLVKSFYEDGDIHIINWQEDTERIEVKNKLDKIYFYISYFRPKYLKLKDKLLNKWNPNINFEDLKNDITKKSFRTLVFYKSTEFNDKILNTYDFIDDKLIELDTHYMNEIVSIRLFLWS